MYKKSLLAFLFLFMIMFVPQTFASTHSRSNSRFVTQGTGGVNVIPYVRSDKKALFVDFENFNSNIDHVYYNLNYKQKNGMAGGVEGSFFPSVTPFTGYHMGKGYIRREIPFGSCSGKRCILHEVKDVRLTIMTHMKSGRVKTFTRVFNFPNDQF